MTSKEIIRAILRTATLITIFVVLLSIIAYSFENIGIEVTIGGTIFWCIVCGLTAIKISFIKEDF